MVPHRAVNQCAQWRSTDSPLPVRANGSNVNGDVQESAGDRTHQGPGALGRDLALVHSERDPLAAVCRIRAPGAADARFTARVLGAQLAGRHSR
jgi:hypothetical protein